MEMRERERWRLRRGTVCLCVCVCVCVEDRGGRGKNILKKIVERYKHRRILVFSLFFFALLFILNPFAYRACASFPVDRTFICKT